MRIKRPPFALFPEEKHWWSFADYGAVLAVMERLRPRRVLEFGPGNSTLALVEGGADHIDCCEDNPIWFDVYKERLVSRFPGQIGFIPFEWSDPLSTPIDDQRYDLALIDGPFGAERRPAVLAYCLARCAAVLIPTEDLAYGHGALRPHIATLAAAFNRQITWIESGPLSGAFALLTHPEEI